MNPTPPVLSFPPLAQARARRAELKARVAELTSALSSAQTAFDVARAADPIDPVVARKAALVGAVVAAPKSVAAAAGALARVEVDLQAATDELETIDAELPDLARVASVEIRRTAAPVIEDAIRRYHSALVAVLQAADALQGLHDQVHAFRATKAPAVALAAPMPDGIVLEYVRAEDRRLVDDAAGNGYSLEETPVEAPTAP